MKMKSMIALAAAVVAAAVEAAVGVTNIVCQQRYPWNGKVDIDFTVTSDDANADVWVYPIGYDKDANVSMACRALEGAGVNAPVKPGRHRMTWNVTADYPDFASTAFNVKMIALTGGAPYMVVDLSGGVDAQSYPVTYLSSVPAGGWTDEYKTTKLVLRLIPPGTFMMGSPSDELGREFGFYGYGMEESHDGELLHKVTLTKPFYIGVFEVTQKQYTLVMGSNPSYYKGDARPVEKVSYDAIRGSVNGAAWPAHNQVDANSFMGRLRSKVNMLFDLPTEAQWEYACRAGTGTALNNGKTINSMLEVGRFDGNKNDGKGGYNGGHTKVGMYKENSLGIYDMHGNVWEQCLDWLGAYQSTHVFDPKGKNSGSWRACRGGGTFPGAGSCRSAARGRKNNGSAGSGVSEMCGFRVACLPAE